jgi:hypothetical protein
VPADDLLDGRLEASVSPILVELFRGNGDAGAESCETLGNDGDFFASGDTRPRDIAQCRAITRTSAGDDVVNARDHETP